MYTSHYRAQIEPCRADADKADLDSMELLEFSRISPAYIFTRVKLGLKYFKRGLEVINRELDGLCRHLEAD